MLANTLKIENKKKIEGLNNLLKSIKVININ